MSKKVQTILSLIEIAETNLRNAKNLLGQYLEDSGSGKYDSPSTIITPGRISKEEEEANDVVEGYFDGEYMIGDNSQTYLVPQNYASKTQLVVGDRMKWILTPNREIFKLIQPVDRKKVEGVFSIDGENYMVFVEELVAPVKILKASATFAMKTQGLQPGDVVSILVPKDSDNPRWGAFLTVVKSGNVRADIGEQSKIEENNFKDLEVFKNTANHDNLTKKVFDFDDDEYL